MENQLTAVHPDLTLMLQKWYLVRRSVDNNPRIVEDGEHGEVIRYFIAAPTNNAVRQILDGELRRRGLPYTFVRVEFSAMNGTYVDFKVKS